MPKSLVAISLAVTAILGPGPHPAAAEAPTWIASEPSDPSGRPLWVSVEVALTTDNSLRSELFSPEFAAAIDRLNEQSEERQRAAQSSGDEVSTVCSAVVPYDCEQLGPSRGLKPVELYANGRFILAGRVTDLRQGIFRETVGRLFEVVVEETVKAPAGARPQRALYLFLREPVVSLRLRRFCIDGASRRPPAIGARVLLLLDEDPASLPGGVVVPLDNDLFLERSDGRLSAPRGFPAEGLSFDGLLRDLRAARCPGSTPLQDSGLGMQSEASARARRKAVSRTLRASMATVSISERTAASRIDTLCEFLRPSKRATGTAAAE